MFFFKDKEDISESAERSLEKLENICNTKNQQNGINVSCGMLTY